jgi:hypothetical protein
MASSSTKPIQTRPAPPPKPQAPATVSIKDGTRISIIASAK